MKAVSLSGPGISPEIKLIDVEQILLQQKHSEFIIRTTRPIGAQSPALIGPQRFLVEREAAGKVEGGGACQSRAVRGPCRCRGFHSPQSLNAPFFPPICFL